MSSHGDHLVDEPPSQAPEAPPLSARSSGARLEVRAAALRVRRRLQEKRDANARAPTGHTGEIGHSTTKVPAHRR